MVKLFNKFILIFILIFVLTNYLFSIGAESTFKLEKINNEYVPFQDKIPYASFEYDDKDIIWLNGKWKIQKISLNHNLSLEKRTKKVIKELEKESKGRYKTHYKDKKWKVEKIPHVNNLFPNRYQDGMWYRKRVVIHKKYKNKNLRIFFQGVNYTTDVWINGEYVGFHEGGYTPFAFDITKYIRYGKKNTISIRVDNIPWLKSNTKDDDTNQHDIVPYKTVDWWNYGGINRDVYIKASEKIHIVRVNIKSKILPENKAEVKASIIINNTFKKIKKAALKIKIFEAKVTKENILNPSAKAIINYKKEVFIDSEKIDNINIKPKSVDVVVMNRIISDIKKWSPESPNLYVMRITLSQGNKVLENYYTQFGIREIRVNKEELSIELNNDAIFLQGIARHEDHPEYGRALSFKDIARVYEDLKIIKDANADFLKTAHYPNHPITYLLADRMGFMVMEEIPVIWFDGEEFNLQREDRGIAKGMWLEMIYRDYNRPSILFWSTCAECGSQKERNKFMMDLKEIAYKIDGTRLVGQAAVGADKRDKSHTGADYIGITSYYGVFYENSYYYDTKKALAQLGTCLPGMPIIANEIGYWSETDFRSVNRQIEVAYNTIRAYQESKYSSGVCWWVAFDWYTMNGNPYQTMGLVTADRKILKPVYFEIQQLYGEIPEDAMVILSPEENKVIQKKVQLVLQFNSDFKVQALVYKIDNEAYRSVKGPYKQKIIIPIDTLKYDDGKKFIIVRAEDNNDIVITRQRKTFIDNYDDPPILKILNSPRLIACFYDLRIYANDDNDGLRVFYQIDKNAKKMIHLVNKEKKLYRNLIDMSSFKDDSLHQINIIAIDNAGNVVKESLKFEINRKKQTFITLPFNLDRISYNDKREDAFEWSFPAEQLPIGDSFEFSADNSGVQFFLGSKENGASNILVCKGQTLDVPEGKYKKIHIFGYSYWGNQKNECTLEYKDGSFDTEDLLLSEWNGATPFFNDKIAWYCDHHHEDSGKEGSPDVAFYHTVLKCNKNKVLIKLELPDDNHKHIIAITLE